jgi:DNA sulfur modification protein DndE
MIQLTNVRTSGENKQVVSELTKKMGLNTENVIARIAFSYSLASGKRLNLREIKDSKGKEYSKSVLFGNFYPVYVSMVCVAYEIHSSDKDIPRYIKMHIDDGLQMLNEEYRKNPGLSGTDFLIEKMEVSLEMP